MSSRSFSINGVPGGHRVLLSQVSRLLTDHLARGHTHSRATGISLFICQNFNINSLLRLGHFLDRIIMFKATRTGRWSYYMINLLINAFQAKIIVASLVICIASMRGHLIREPSFRDVGLGDIT